MYCGPDLAPNKGHSSYVLIDSAWRSRLSHTGASQAPTWHSASFHFLVSIFRQTRTRAFGWAAGAETQITSCGRSHLCPERPLMYVLTNIIRKLLCQAQNSSPKFQQRGFFFMSPLRLAQGRLFSPSADGLKDQDDIMGAGSGVGVRDSPFGTAADSPRRVFATLAEKVGCRWYVAGGKESRRERNRASAPNLLLILDP